MRLARTSTALLAVLAAAQLATPAAAFQAEAEARQRAIEQALQERAQQERAYFDRTRSGGPVLSVQFGGGSLADYLASLKQAAGDEPTNILVRGDAESIDVAPTQLRDVSLFTALQLVSGEYQSAGNDGFRVTAANLGSGESDGAFLVAVQSFGPSQAGPRRREMLVLSLKEMTTSLPGDPPEVVVPAETILTAVETAVSVADGDSAELKYHAESGLLMMSGDTTTLVAADEVVKRIQNDVRERRDRAREIQRAQGLTNPEQLAAQVADLRAEAELEAVQMTTAHAHMDLLRQRVQEMAAAAEQGVASVEDVRGAQMQMHEAEARIREHQIRFERASERVEQAEEALDRSKAIAAGGGAGTEAQALREENAMLRDRLAVMEAQIQELREQLDAQRRGGGAR